MICLGVKNMTKFQKIITIATILLLIGIVISILRLELMIGNSNQLLKNNIIQNKIEQLGSDNLILVTPNK